MGDQVKSGVLSGVAFGVAMAAVYAAMGNVGAAAAVGVIGGLVFGAAITTVLVVVARRTAANRPDLGGERLIREGTANHFRNGESRGGWLYLTDKTLHFRPHRANIQGQGAAITLADVVDVQPSRTFGLIPNALTVGTTGGAHEKFVLQRRNDWAADIRRALQDRPAA